MLPAPSAPAGQAGGALSITHSALTNEMPLFFFSFSGLPKFGK